MEVKLSPERLKVTEHRSAKRWAHGLQRVGLSPPNIRCRISGTTPDFQPLH
jgi:hypothetical protein